MKRIVSALLLAAVCLAALPSVARADVAPPQQPPGSNPGPGDEITQVRMLAETVVIDVRANDPAQAHVTANFTMRNLGSSAENLAVRFPIAASDGFSSYPEIKNVGVKVNDKTTPYRRVLGPEPRYGFEGQDVPWAEFDVSFAPGEDVQIKFSYDLDGTGYEQDGSTSFYYTLSTGAGWNGTIGSAEIVLRLPYDASPQNVILYPEEAAGVEFIGREVHWTYSELEPTTANNLSFQIVKPAIWKQTIIELENIQKNSNDGEAWGRLGKAYKQSLFAAAKGFPRDDPGAPQLYEMSKQAYEKAVTLKPDDGLWHAGYAQLLIDYYLWSNNRQFTPDTSRGLRELELAHRLAPNDPKVKELVEMYGYDDLVIANADGSLTIPYLTETPTPWPDEQLPTETPIPPQEATVTAAPPPATVPPATPAPKPSSPICGGTALILLPVALVFWKTRRNRLS
jgi:hypothetical protein